MLTIEKLSTHNKVWSQRKGKFVSFWLQERLGLEDFVVRFGKTLVKKRSQEPLCSYVGYTRSLIGL